MSKTNRWFLGFFLALLWPVALMLFASEPSPDAVSSQNVVSSASEDATSGIDSAIQMAQQEVRDPFVTNLPQVAETAANIPGPDSQAAAPEIKTDLQGIGFGSKDAYAVMGGEVFYKGDEKMGIKLLEVRRREVDILVNGGKVTVPLFPDQNLQKAKDRAKQKGVAKSVSGNPSLEAS